MVLQQRTQTASSSRMAQPAAARGFGKARELQPPGGGESVATAAFGTEDAKQALRRFGSEQFDTFMWTLVHKPCGICVWMICVMLLCFATATAIVAEEIKWVR